MKWQQAYAAVVGFVLELLYPILLRPHHRPEEQRRRVRTLNRRESQQDGD